MMKEEEDEVELEDEFESLVHSNVSEPWNAPEVAAAARRQRKLFSARRTSCSVGRTLCLVVSCLGIFWGFVAYEKENLFSSEKALSSNNGNGQELSNSLDFQCPAVVKEPDNHAITDEEDYDAVSASILEDIDGFVQSFREMEFDAWGATYNEVKSSLFEWKKESFSDLKSGDSIYESACGIGLNLVMTLEILAEVHNVTNLTVFGSDYVADSIQVANKVMDKGILPGQNHKGSSGICQADSTDLSFVPSDAFDLVFTGYIAPILNPFHLNITDDPELESYHVICQSDMLRQKMQDMQEEWYGAWVGEMIRIAKPGAPVVIEQVSLPLCKFFDDWGGVKKSFWTMGPEKFGWPVDPETYRVYSDDTMEHRYNLFMRKNS